MLETLVRRPAAFKEACSFAVTHKAMGEYMEALGARLDRAIRTLEIEHRGQPQMAAAWPPPHHRVVKRFRPKMDRSGDGNLSRSLAPRALDAPVARWIDSARPLPQLR